MQGKIKRYRSYPGMHLVDLRGEIFRIENFEQKRGVEVRTGRYKSLNGLKLQPFWLQLGDVVEEGNAISRVQSIIFDRNNRVYMAEVMYNGSAVMSTVNLSLFSLMAEL